MKPDNIMIDCRNELPRQYTEGNCFENARIKLVDFGCTTKYVDENGQLMKKRKVRNFKGNLLFCSINQMKFYNVALAATAYAASVLPSTANIGGTTEPKFFAATAPAAGAAASTPTWSWAKGYGGGLNQASKIVVVEIPKVAADVDVKFSAKYTGPLGTATETCPATPVALDLVPAAAAGSTATATEIAA